MSVVDAPIVMDSQIEVGGVTLFVRQLGERQPNRTSLLVLHGGPDVGHSYLLAGVRLLAHDHHVVLFDFRGCGRSSRGLPSEALQPEFVIDDAHELIEALGLGQVDLLGFSTGGRAAIEFVSRFPDAVRRLILASTSAYSSSARDASMTDPEEVLRRHAMEDAAGGALRGSSLALWNLDLQPAYLASIVDLDEGDWSFDRWLKGEMHPWVNGDAEKILRGFTGDTLILHGEKDMQFPVQLAERLHRALPGTELRIVEDAGHLCHCEKPRTWAKHIQAFLG